MRTPLLLLLALLLVRGCSKNEDITKEITTFYHNLKMNGIFTYDELYNYNVNWKHNPYGWYYSGEPEKGYHGK